MITIDELRTLDDAALNRAVAELAGWTEIKRERWWEQEYGDEWGDWTEGDTGFPPGCVNRERLPDYATDLSAAWALFPADVPIFLWRDIYDDAEALSICPVDWYLDWVRGNNAETHASPARALATAWVAWKLNEVNK